MKIKHFREIIFIGVVWLFSSCSTQYYYPTSQNVLRFKEKGDANVAYQYDVHGFESIDLGYSITYNIAIISDFQTYNTYSSQSSVKHKIDDYHWDNELVLYKRFSEYFYPSLNIGYGFGQINRNNEYYKLGFSRQYLQPSFGYSNSFFDFALSTRFARVKHNLKKLKEFNLSDELTFDEYFDIQDVGKKDFYFIEPAVSMGVGYKFVKLRYQYILIQKISSGQLKYLKTNRYLTLNFTFNLNNMLFKKRIAAFNF